VSPRVDDALDGAPTSFGDRHASISPLHVGQNGSRARLPTAVAFRLARPVSGLVASSRSLVLWPFGSVPFAPEALVELRAR
jgi:hypothetical protein